ncbi:Mitochondrial import inner membrane translocase subunit Tim21 [Phaffia rhodozyma]|uniref:Mitochondrial import inner membrane translocase subunit Tim21 n=1 Tax=Phaffia rhodozyma TaxID=264483 RepID=A0A0F7SX02_PHARH|nr:Mitochondrial import inner membrane translocase subunit Tim21 [Phaffia rhodozyma]
MATILPKMAYPVTSNSFRRYLSSTVPLGRFSAPKTLRNHRTDPLRSPLYTNRGVQQEFKPRSPDPNSNLTQDGTGAPYHAGPYPIGAGLGTSAFRRQAPRKAWKELGWGSKLYRVGANSSNLLVVALGGSLFFIIAISVSTELFSPNSTTVIFGKAVDKLKEQDELKHYLLPPYTYHPPHTTTPSSRSQTSSSRYRLTSFPSNIYLDPRTGRETHSFIFLVEGQEQGSFRSHTGWWGSWRDWTLEQVEKGWKETKRLASDAQMIMKENGWISSDEEIVLGDDKRLALPQTAADKSSTGWGLGSLFGLKKGERVIDVVKKRGLPPVGQFQTGECHVVCEKNSESHRLELKSMKVYIPSSSASRPYTFSVPVEDNKSSWFDSIFGSNTADGLAPSRKDVIGLVEDARLELEKEEKELGAKRLV